MPGRIDPVNAITLLGILTEGPRSGYALRRVIDERLPQIVEMSSGSLYYALQRFEARGWVRGSLSRRGRRPERRVYRLTPGGRLAFRRLLEEAAIQSDRFYSPFDMALYFAPHLPPASLLRAVEKRLDDLGRYREALRRLEERYPDRWPFHFYYLREKAKEIADTNERWCVRLRRKIQEKSLARG
jgi:DNA-binding PadR family transcriptional regulator